MGDCNRGSTNKIFLCLALALLPACGDLPVGASDTPAPGLGPGASLEGRRPFPDNSPWNTDVSSAPIDPNSTALIASCGIRNLHPDFGTTWNGAPNGIPYIVGYFFLTMGFTYFYTAFTFKPDETADQLRKNGGFIPGIRPGAPTRDYLAKVVFRLSLAGAIFLATIAVAPIILGSFFQGGAVGGFALGGTALLIVVSVVVETMKQIEAQLMMRNYEGFIR